MFIEAARSRLIPLLNPRDPQLHGLVCWLPLNHQVGHAFDVTRYRRHGALNNISWVEAGDARYGEVVPAFNGTSSSIDLSFFQPPVGASPRTVTAWIYTGVDSSTAGTIVDYGTDATGQDWVFRISNLNLQVAIQGANYITTAALTLNTWHFVALTLSGTTLADHTFYIDGVAEAASGANTVNTGTTHGLWIGLRKVLEGTFPQWLNGRLQDFRMYDRALTYEEIQDVRLYPYRPLTNSNPVVAAMPPDPADEEALAWLTYGQAWHPALPVGGAGALTEADRQHLLHGLRDPLWQNSGGALIAQQKHWYEQAGAL